MPSLPSRPLLALMLASSVFLSAAPAAQAQFGRNKVQYEDFEFRVLKTDHFDVYFYPDESEAAAIAARMAERWYSRLSTVFDHELTGRQPLVLYASSAQFQQTNVIGGMLGEGTGGVTESLLRRIVMPIGGTLADLDHVLGHELVHAFQYDITGGGEESGSRGIPGAARLPLWFIEGMAEYLSIGPVAPLTAMWVRGATQDELPSFRDLEDPRFFPYRYGHALLAYVGGRWGDEAIAALLRASSRTDVARGIETVLSVSPDSLIGRWHTAVREAYAPLMATTEPASTVATSIVAVQGEGEEGRYNVAPSLSPDGERVMFLSDRGLFSIDLYLADARTGEIQRQVTETALDPHLQSLQFIQSAGTWSPDGTRFVFSGISSGRPLLALYNVDEDEIEREVHFPELGEILNPSWSPDGRYIAFSGVAGGLADLFVYDLETGSERRLTNDPFADLQPAWSPDGRSLAFATDRFSTNLETLGVGKYRLGLVDIATGAIRAVGGLEGAKQINPQWSPDGANVYFLADPNGVTNVYRIAVAGGEVAQLTDLYTGASGITETSPALSVAQQSGRLAFSVFRSDGYDIFGIDSAAALAGMPVDSGARADDAITAAALPPQDRSPDVLTRVLADLSTGLPADTAFPVEPYRPGLGLVAVGQPSLVAGTSEFGSFVGGGAALYFSDLLGNRNLMTAFQVNGGLKDITALAAYTNLSNRWNWTAVAQQVPYVTGGFAQGQAELDGEQVFVEQRFLARQTNRDLAGIVSYPFSQVHRVDFSGGYTNITFDRELRTRAFSFQTGQLLLEEEESLASPETLHLGSASAALVYDNSIFGATSPIRGQRYRVEVTPSFGSIDYVGVLADFRRYFYPVRPFTFAVRLVHFGRYGSGGEDSRLQPLFLGYNSLVRGYSYGSFEASECDAPADAPGSCPVFDQLLGSRIAVGSAELRFPLLGVLGVGSGYYGALPLELAFFGDAGLAWTEGDSPSLFGGSGTREPVFSAGVGLRFNLFGFAILELDFVRPFDRPEKGWLWQFGFQPGF